MRLVALYKNGSLVNVCSEDTAIATMCASKVDVYVVIGSIRVWVARLPYDSAVKFVGRNRDVYASFEGMKYSYSYVTPGAVVLKDLDPIPF